MTFQNHAQIVIKVFFSFSQSIDCRRRRHHRRRHWRRRHRRRRHCRRRDAVNNGRI